MNVGRRLGVQRREGLRSDDSDLGNIVLGLVLSHSFSGHRSIVTGDWAGINNFGSQALLEFGDIIAFGAHIEFSFETIRRRLRRRRGRREVLGRRNLSVNFIELGFGLDSDHARLFHAVLLLESFDRFYGEGTVEARHLSFRID